MQDAYIYYQLCIREELIIYQPTPHMYYNTVILMHVD